MDSRGYLRGVEANFRQPLADPARAAFEAGGGAELRAQGSRPPKMQALHSSAALAVNVFDHWADRDAAPLQQSLRLDSKILSLAFEAKFDTGLPGSPPNLDVALELDSGSVVGIESKFTEWLMPKRAHRQAFKDKYFEGGKTLWADRGLTRCQALAGDMLAGRSAFRYLDAAQLLKHALGLATQRAGRCQLAYLYMDIPCPASEAHREEIDRFAERIDAALAFSAESYQALVRRMSAILGVDPEYLRYLRLRYCGDRA